MKRFAISFAVGIIALCTLQTQCKPAAVMRPRTHHSTTAPPDDWQRTATWLYATDKARSGHAPECQHVGKLLEGESSCKGVLCRFPAELAGEWLDKCAKLVPDAVETISDQQAELSDQAERKPSKCARQLKRFLDDGCEPEHCIEDAQEWATRCGETEASPLVVSMLAKVVARQLDAKQPIKLDSRSCEALDKQMVKRSRCKSEAACKKAWKTLRTRKARCSDPDELPEIVWAMRQLSIAAGAVRDVEEPTKIAADPEFLSADDLPLVLADGSGAVFAVCHQRVTELDEYLAARKECSGGFVYLARAFDEGDEREIRMGEMPVRDGWNLLDMFPDYAVVGEKRRAEKKQARSLAATIDAAIDAQDDSGLGKLVAALDAGAPQLFHSRRIRKILKERDDKLVSLFETAAVRKVRDGRSMNADERRGMAFRAKNNPLADLSRVGAVDTQARTRAAWLATEDLLPEATAAYRIKLAPLHKLVRRGAKLSPSAGARAAASAQAAAAACAQAQQAEAKAHKRLAACVFDNCDDDEIAELLEAREQANTAAQTQLHTLFIAVSSVESEQLPAIADAADCTLASLEN